MLSTPPESETQPVTPKKFRLAKGSYGSPTSPNAVSPPNSPERAPEPTVAKGSPNKQNVAKSDQWTEFRNVPLVPTFDRNVYTKQRLSRVTGHAAESSDEYSEVWEEMEDDESQGHSTEHQSRPLVATGQISQSLIAPQPLVERATADSLHPLDASMSAPSLNATRASAFQLTGFSKASMPSLRGHLLVLVKRSHDKAKTGCAPAGGGPQWTMMYATVRQKKLHFYQDIGRIVPFRSIILDRVVGIRAPRKEELQGQAEDRLVVLEYFDGVDLLLLDDAEQRDKWLAGLNRWREARETQQKLDSDLEKSQRLNASMIASRASPVLLWRGTWSMEESGRGVGLPRSERKGLALSPLNTARPVDGDADGPFEEVWEEYYEDEHGAAHPVPPRPPPVVPDTRLPALRNHMCFTAPIPRPDKKEGRPASIPRMTDLYGVVRDKKFMLYEDIGSVVPVKVIDFALTACEPIPESAKKKDGYRSFSLLMTGLRETFVVDNEQLRDKWIEGLKRWISVPARAPKQQVNMRSTFTHELSHGASLWGPGVDFPRAAPTVPRSLENDQSGTLPQLPPPQPQESVSWQLNAPAEQLGVFQQHQPDPSQSPYQNSALAGAPPAEQAAGVGWGMQGADSGQGVAYAYGDGGMVAEQHWQQGQDPHGAASWQYQQPHGL